MGLMSQNIYDDPQFFQGYRQLRRAVEGLSGAAEWPAIRALLPDLRGLRVLDLGCGFGWFCRWALDQGAAEVVGIDVSENMLAQARAADPRITYRRADLETLRLPRDSFDLVYSTLALHYLENFAALVAEAHATLRRGGDFIFSIEHPIFMAARNTAWTVDTEGRRTWPVDGYSLEGPRRRKWFVDGVIKQHRKLATTVNTLIDAGFELRRIDEWSPTDEQIAHQPDLAEDRERPIFLIVSARRR